MTTISIIVSLVFWSSMWGIIGAVLSVPLLSLMAILLQEADHPLAARLLHGIREDSKVDELREALKMKRITVLSSNLTKLASAPMRRRGASTGFSRVAENASVEVVAV